jgi:hypothetical protein
MLLLLPLGLIAIASYGLDLRIPIGISTFSQSILLETLRVLIPGILTITVAYLLPTFNRQVQISFVSLNYAFLTCCSLFFYGEFFTLQTPFILSSLVSALFMLPSNDVDNEYDHNFYKIDYRRICAMCIAPFTTLLFIMVLITNIEHSIVLTFSELFIDSVISCLFLPIYEIMLMLGFSTMLNSIVTLQSENTIITSIINSILFVNMFALPAAIFTRAHFEKNYIRLFLFFLAIIAVLTFNIGICVSIELLILFLFFSSTFFSLCVCSIIIFFCINYFKIDEFANLYALYQPDLHIRGINFRTLQNGHYISIFVAILTPFLLQLCFVKQQKLKAFIRLKHNRNTVPILNIKELNSPELFLIAILHAIGNSSNLKAAELDGEFIILKVFSLKHVNTVQISLISHRSYSIEQNSNLIRLFIGSKAFIVYKRLVNISRENQEIISEIVSQSKPFDIRQYVQDLKEKKKSE